MMQWRRIFNNVNSFLFAVLVLFAIPTLGVANELSFNIPATITSLKPNRHAMVGRSAQNQLEQAYSLSSSGKPAEALSLLKEVLTRYQQNPVIVSHALRTAGYILAEKNELTHATEIFEQVVRLNSLEEESLLKLKHLLAQLYVQLERYGTAVNVMQNWMSAAEAKDITAQDHYLLALCYYQLERYREAIQTSVLGLKTRSDKTEHLLRLQLNSHLALKEYKQASGIAERLVGMNSKEKNYWVLWYQSFLIANQSKNALNTMELMATKHALTDSETLRLSYLMLEHGFPERAAKLLKSALDSSVVEINAKHLRLLSQTWEQAGHLDKAVRALQSSSASLNDRQNLKRLVYLLGEQERWLEILTVLEKQLGTTPETWQEEIERENGLWFLLQLGQTYYQIGKIEHARAVFGLLNKQNAQQTQADEFARFNDSISQWYGFLEALSQH